jgi:Uma2 family endonuclease
MSTAARRKTNAELCAEADALPPPIVGEVIDGVLYAMGRPSPSHQNVEGGIIVDLKGGPRGGGPPPPAGWYIQLEVEIRFPNDEKAVPDVSGWRNERIAGHRNDNPIRVVPDWVCEILSDSTRPKDLGPKRDMHARHGVKHLWIVEPEARVLETFALDADGKWKLLASFVGDAAAHAAPFEETALTMERWWLREE